jgi:hypothetical protein
MATAPGIRRPLANSSRSGSSVAVVPWPERPRRIFAQSGEGEVHAPARVHVKFGAGCRMTAISSSSASFGSRAGIATTSGFRFTSKSVVARPSCGGNAADRPGPRAYDGHTPFGAARGRKAWRRRSRWRRSGAERQWRDPDRSQRRHCCSHRRGQTRPSAPGKPAGGR